MQREAQQIQEDTGVVVYHQGLAETSAKAPKSSHINSLGSSEKQSTEKHMDAAQIITLLIQHRCPDVTHRIDLDKCGSVPASGGGFGDIYLGALEEGEKIAIKCARLYLKHDDMDHKVLKRAARELYAWSSLKHINVLELIGLATFRGQIAMISLWMENGTLPQYISRYPETDRYHLCLQVSEGLAYLHRAGTVHGDIKGLNVLVSKEGVPKITDFGNTALKNSTLQFTGTTTGSNFSLRWTAPELLNETASYSEPADIYALGMTFLEIITGQIPFPQKMEPNVFVNVVVLQKIPERPAELDLLGGLQGERLWGLMFDCWAYDPVNRPTAESIRDQMRNNNREEGDSVPRSEPKSYITSDLASHNHEAESPAASQQRLVGSEPLSSTSAK